MAVVGAGHALGGEGRRDGVPTRSTLAACVVVGGRAWRARSTFGASVRSLLDTPASYGWTADLAIHSGGGYDFLDPDGAEAAAETRGIAALTVAGFGDLSFGDDEVNGMGFVPVEGDALVTVVEGRLPREPDEVAFGADTARGLEVAVGEEIEESSGRLRVVGLVALPAIGPAASAHPSLGQGALMTLEGINAANENSYPSLVLVRVADGVDLDEAESGITEGIAATMSEYREDPVLAMAYADAYQDLRPSEVVGLAPASRTANLLAGLLGAASVLALGLTLSSSVRRRRRTYAVLSAIGLDRGDLRQTVRWQLNIVTLLALVIGLPIGVVLGRVAWTAFAEQLGAAGDPRIPFALLARGRRRSAPAGQPRRRVARPRRRSAAVAASPSRCALARRGGAAVPEAAEQVGAQLLLVDVGGEARRLGLRREVAPLVGRAEEHDGAGHLRHDLAGGLDAVHPWAC